MNNSINRLWWIILPVLFVATAGITLVLADDNNGTEQAEHATPVITQTAPPANDSLFAMINAGFQTIKPALEKSCFDCHSNKVKYPWYYKLPIIKGMIDEHNEEGREHLDYSKDFPFAGKGSQADMLTGIREEIEEGEMPLCSYRLTHWGRLIEGPLQDTVFAWIDSSLARLATVGIVPAEKKTEEEHDED